MSILRAIGKDQAYTFNSDVILHLREPDLVGMQNGGWGVPQALYCYGTSRHNFGLRKMNEAITGDYMLPIRVFSPSQAKNTGQAIGANNIGMINDMADWNRQMRGIIAAHRRDPSAIHTLGFPFDYTVCGGEGKSLVSPELLIRFCVKLLPSKRKAVDSTERVFSENSNNLSVENELAQKGGDIPANDIASPVSAAPAGNFV